MSRFQQGSLLKLKRKNSPDVWVFRWYDETNGTRTYKKRTLGKVTDMPLRRDAEKAVADFRANINVEVRVPQTVSDLAAHYRKYELTSDKKAFATIESPSIYLSNHIVPKWGDVWMSDVSHRRGRTVVAFFALRSSNTEQNPQHYVGPVQSWHPA